MYLLFVWLFFLGIKFFPRWIPANYLFYSSGCQCSSLTDRIVLGDVGKCTQLPCQYQQSCREKSCTEAAGWPCYKQQWFDWGGLGSPEGRLLRHSPECKEWPPRDSEVNCRQTWLLLTSARSCLSAMGREGSAQITQNCQKRTSNAGFLIIWVLQW